MKKTYICPDGEWYGGELKDDDFLHGHGTYTWPRGEKYVGGWRDGKQHDQGTFTWSDGAKYVGEWKDDNPWNGTEYDKDGTVIATYSEGVETKI